VFERFTERARQVVVLAQEEARGLGHRYIGTEHILLGLLREEEGLAARVLANLGVTLEDVRGRVVAIVARGESEPSGQIPFTPRAKKVLERALREALSLGHNHIGTEHILLGLVREKEGVAVQILLDLDADLEQVHREVISMLAGAPVDPVPRGESAWDESWQPSLQWESARVIWGRGGSELEIPLRLEHRAVELLERSPIWQAEPLAGATHEIRRGVLRISAPSLLESVDPRQLRRVLDEAVSRAHEEAAQARSREAVVAEAFLAALREQPQA
jgi:ATP-dependent Clp protease ATP-binding subunit ClpA